METTQPLILVTNDDGITAPGIRTLVEAVRPLGRLVVVAPDSPQSGTGHAITIAKPLRLEKVKVFDGIDSWQCSGTPVDCVKLAVGKVLHRKPDLVVSGVNHGSNSSINVIYSGTMSAAVEAAIEHIPAIGFSLLNHRHEADMDASFHVARHLTEVALKEGIPPGSVLNVNIPDLPHEEMKGYRVCRQAVAKWVEEFDERTDPYGRKYYWLTGKFVNFDKGEDTDEHALAEGYVSIVPVQHDLTAHHAIPLMQNWQQDEMA